MTQGLRPTIIAILLVTVFTFALFTFSLSFVNNSNPSSELFNQNYGLNNSLTKLNSSMSDFSSLSNQAKDTLQQSNPSPAAFLFLIFEGAFTIPKLFISFGINSVNIIFDVLFPILGGTGLGSVLALVFGIIVDIIIVTLVFLIIKNIRTGESEH